MLLWDLKMYHNMILFTIMGIIDLKTTEPIGTTFLHIFLKSQGSALGLCKLNILVKNYSK